MVPDALHRPAALAGIERVGIDFLPDIAKGAVSRLESPSEVSAVPDVPGYRFVGQQLESSHGSAAGDQVELQENTEVQNRDQKRPMGNEKIPWSDRCHAYARIVSRGILRTCGVVCFR